MVEDCLDRGDPFVQYRIFIPRAARGFMFTRRQHFHRRRECHLYRVLYTRHGDHHGNRIHLKKETATDPRKRIINIRRSSFRLKRKQAVDDFVNSLFVFTYGMTVYFAAW